MIELTNLTKVYDGDVVAVDRWALSVAAGEVYGLLGPNGAGKTRTLRMILGLYAPSSHEAPIQGCHVTTEPFLHKAAHWFGPGQCWALPMINSTRSITRLC
ncbi:ATP-binding cassette domain-containing protein [Thalassoroseus pseudoceratinae]|uniref:ATP-binding cassette domain-containing protein n=1 Tax=Thalassoroseus pseudoceratinae TaxID=2713176 RepID=UPI00142389CC|nr:ATP-binding cassette domain-containing protein [Thalassoroseus pseudoceratinae]